jgi:hypothetical protein
MYQKEENLTENHTSPVVSEIYKKKQSIMKKLKFFHEYNFLERRKPRQKAQV